MQDWETMIAERNAMHGTVMTLRIEDAAKRRHYMNALRFKPNLKGGHTHNHQRNALKRMRRCRGCDKPITKYEGFKSHFSGHICMECHVENCLEHASMVGISIQWPLFEELYNPYIRRK